MIWRAAGKKPGRASGDDDADSSGRRQRKRGNREKERERERMTIRELMVVGEAHRS